ncbi:MAG: hypothetical protein K0S23_924 [Fluviicola sp.]|jgi:hypothetical protein|uniref:hypothetical protein n=1 Tax=Fluviicola sp. TaxID=1917219 RepID=UPI002617E2BA|nr:hypothetical protein [Fluviicola sp.]MDF3026617.1 hypothetical protein [Fluviicola sp.]
MKKLALLSFIFLAAGTYAQDLPAPPTLAMPTKENTILIDKLVKTMKLKEYFIIHASAKIDYLGMKKNWSEKQISARKADISFEKFNDETRIYNAFSEFTKRELEDLINLSTKINGGLSEPKILFTVPMLEQNMDLFIENEYLK